MRITYCLALLIVIKTSYVISWPHLSGTVSSKTSLRSAIDANNYALITQLIKEGHSIDEECEGVTALRKMIENDNEPMVNFLLDNGADVGNSLYIAVLNRKERMIELLLKRGANPMTGTLEAIKFANAEILFQFMDHGLDIQGDMVSLINVLKESPNLFKEKLASLFSHGWVNAYNKDYKKYIACLKTLFLMHNRPGTLFNRLPKEVVVYICTQLPGGFWVKKGSLIKQHEDVCVQLEVDRRVQQVEKLLRTHNVARCKQKVKNGVKKNGAYVTQEEHIANGIIDYLDAKKVSENWLSDIKKQVSLEYEQGRSNTKKRKFDEISQ